MTAKIINAKAPQISPEFIINRMLADITKVIIKSNFILFPIERNLIPKNEISPTNPEIMAKSYHLPTTVEMADDNMPRVIKSYPPINRAIWNKARIINDKNIVTYILRLISLLFVTRRVTRKETTNIKIRKLAVPDSNPCPKTDFEIFELKNEEIVREAIIAMAEKNRA